MIIFWFIVGGSNIDGDVMMVDLIELKGANVPTAFA